VFKSLDGVYAPDAGTIELACQHRREQPRVAKLAREYVPEHPAVRELDVLDNVRTAAGLLARSACYSAAAHAAVSVAKTSPHLRARSSSSTCSHRRTLAHERAKSLP